MMKNIYVLPTDKPSKLGFDSVKNLHFVNDYIDDYQNFFITSDEEIKDVRPHKGKWQLEKGQILNKFPNYLTDLSECKLVIMTTDQDLIKDGIQAIGDEFLEWFVKNPSCEEVKVETLEHIMCAECLDNPTLDCGFHEKYKIIIPKEELKQELSTRLKNSLIQFNINLDEAFDLPDWKLKTIGFSNRSILELKTLKEESKQETLEEAAKDHLQFWRGRQEQDKSFYNKEHLWEAYKVSNTIFEDEIALRREFEKWFEQFKKK